MRPLASNRASTSPHARRARRPSARRHVVAVCAALALLAGGCTEQVGGAGGGTPPQAFVSLYQSSTFQMCRDCHAPNAPGATAGTEATQDWSTATSAFESLKGAASGLIGNFEGCNGVPLVGATADTSLLVAVLDANVRAQFSVPGHPACTADAITDETLRVGTIDPDTLQSLKDFINGGGFNMPLQ